MKNRFYTAQQIAEELGVSKQTLVRYEKKGIFPRPRRNLVNQWREYTPADVVKLKKILGRA